MAGSAVKRKKPRTARENHAPEGGGIRRRSENAGSIASTAAPARRSLWAWHYATFRRRVKPARGTMGEQPALASNPRRRSHQNIAPPQAACEGLHDLAAWMCATGRPMVPGRRQAKESAPGRRARPAALRLTAGLRSRPPPEQFLSEPFRGRAGPALHAVLRPPGQMATSPSLDAWRGLRHRHPEKLRI